MPYLIVTLKKMGNESEPIYHGDNNLAKILAKLAFLHFADIFSPSSAKLHISYKHTCTSKNNIYYLAIR